MPTLTPPRPSERGVDGRPTLLQNVETMAHIGLIARYGADWFCRAGTDEEPGSMLVTIGGAVRVPGVHEIEIGTPLREVLALARRPRRRRRRRARGGLLRHLAADRRSHGGRRSRAPGSQPVGGSVGAGTIVVLPRTACGLVETARVARYLAARERGTVRPVRLRAAGARGRLDRARRRAGRGRRRFGSCRSCPSVIERRGACAHPDGAARLVRSALRGVPARGAGCTSRGAARRPIARPSFRSRRPPANGAEVTAHLRLDPIACDGHGNCHELLPELIGLDRWGYPDHRRPGGARRRSSGTPAARSRCARSSPSPWSDGRRAEAARPADLLAEHPRP